MIVIIRFLKNPYPDKPAWSDVAGRFDVIHHYLEPRQYPTYPSESFHVVGEIDVPRDQRWSSRSFRRAGEAELWQIVAYANQRGFEVGWYFDPIIVQYTPKQVYTLDVKDGWHIGGWHAGSERFKRREINAAKEA